VIFFSIFFLNLYINLCNCKYQVVPNWPTIPQKISPFGAVSAVSTHRDNLVFIAQRGTVAPPVVIFNAEGRFRGAFGTGIIATPHGLRIDPHNFVWVSDVENQQIFQFALNGTLVRSLGIKGKAGNTTNPMTFNQPTDFAFDILRNALYVADGDNGVNNRIIRLNYKTLDVDWVVEPGPAISFDQPHSLAVDRIGRLWVADRLNNRTLTFDSKGNFIDSWNCWNSPPNGLVFDQRNQRFIVSNSTNSVFRLSMPSQRTINDIGKCVVQETFGGSGNNWGQFDIPHEMGVDLEGDLYVAEIGNQRVQKFIWVE